MGPLPTPEEAARYDFTASDRAIIDEALASHIIGDPGSVRAGLQALVTRTGANELMLSTRVHDYAARERSYALIAQDWGLMRIDAQ
jgi:alkanesulfonate monooxygenase SsuD/methylene tetrahydromethanopterin reductase-like flavin-dependent oxidoreductase (luciferase family)